MDFISWNIGTPVLWGALAVSILFSIWGFEKGSFTTILLSTIISVAVAYLGFWSIGIYLVVVPLLQLLAAFIVLIK